MARLTSWVVLALVAFTSAAPIALPQSFDVSPGLGQALQVGSAAAVRDPALEPAAAGRDPALEPAATPAAGRDPALEPAAPPAAGRDPALEPAAPPAAGRDPALEPVVRDPPPVAAPPADRAKEEADRIERERADRERAERERADPARAERDRAEREKLDRERGRGAGRGNGRNQLDICAAALQQIAVNLAETGPQLRDLNAEFSVNNADLAQLFGVMQEGLRGTQAAAIKIVDAVGRGGAAPAAERQIMITGLGAARDALARLDSSDRAVAGRLKQARASLRQTIVTANQILRNCGVGRDDGAATSVAVTSTMDVPPEETGVSSVATARPTAVVVSRPPVAAPTGVVVPPPVDNAAQCPPAVTVTAPVPARETVTVVVTAGAAVPSGVAQISSAASAAPSAVVSSIAASSSAEVSSAVPSGAAPASSAASAASSVIATLRPAPAARR